MIFLQMCHVSCMKRKYKKRLKVLKGCTYFFLNTFKKIYKLCVSCVWGKTCLDFKVANVLFKINYIFIYIYKQ